MDEPAAPVNLCPQCGAQYGAQDTAARERSGLHSPEPGPP